MNAFVLAGESSGVGKTTLAIGLMKALEDYGKVIPFKAGPDFIDPMYHKAAVGVDSGNLDTVLCGEKGVRLLFKKRMLQNSIGIVEGVMGMHDGVSSLDGFNPGFGSSAHIAEILNIPVILVVKSIGVSRSLAALVKGYKDFSKAKMAGVIINQVASKRSYSLQKEAIENEAGVKVFGFLPNISNCVFGSRHLGLLQPSEINGFNKKLDRLSSLVKENIDLSSVLSDTKVEKLPEVSDPFKPYFGRYEGLNIGIAMDDAFSFYYSDNLNLLRDLGCSLTFFSPLKDQRLPKNLDALYIGGGYPEVFACTLEKNRSFRESLRGVLESGLPCYAECGGMLYLGESIESPNGSRHEGVGFFPINAEMTDRLIDFGYCKIRYNFVNGIQGELCAHEFHKTRLREKFESVFIIERRKKQRPGSLVKALTIAGYPHFHFYAQPDGPKLVLKALDFIKGKA